MAVSHLWQRTNTLSWQAPASVVASCGFGSQTRWILFRMALCSKTAPFRCQYIHERHLLSIIHVSNCCYSSSLQSTWNPETYRTHFALWSRDHVTYMHTLVNTVNLWIVYMTFLQGGRKKVSPCMISQKVVPKCANKASCGEFDRHTSTNILNYY